MAGKPGDLPKFADMMPLVLDALKDLGGSASIDELNEWVAEKLELSEADLEITYPKSGDYVFRDRVSWARSYLKQGGYVDNSRRGVWTITPEGRQATLEEVADVPRRVVNEYNRRKAKEAPGLDEPAAEERDWKEELLDHLGQMAPEAFERLLPANPAREGVHQGRSDRARRGRRD